MTLATDIANDYTAFDGAEAVTFSVVVNNAVSATVSVSSALRRALTKQAGQLSAAGLALEPEDVSFHLPVSLLSGNTPKPGDLITDASSVVFTILAATKATLGTRYACVCRQRRA